MLKNAFLSSKRGKNSARRRKVESSPKRQSIREFRSMTAGHSVCFHSVPLCIQQHVECLHVSVRALLNGSSARLARRHFCDCFPLVDWLGAELSWRPWDGQALLPYPSHVISMPLPFYVTLPCGFSICSLQHGKQIFYMVAQGPQESKSRSLYAFVRLRPRTCMPACPCVSWLKKVTRLVHIQGSTSQGLGYKKVWVNGGHQCNRPSPQA